MNVDDSERAPDAAVAAQIEGRLTALLAATGSLAAASAAERHSIILEARAELARMAASDRTEAEKIAWVSAFNDVFETLNAAVNDEVENDRQTRERFPSDQLWSYVDDESSRERPAILDVLVQSAAMGVFRDGGRVKRPLSDEWLDPRLVPELTPGFEEWKRATTWKVRVGTTEYQVEGVDGLAKWVDDGRVDPGTVVFDPHARKWMKARDVAKLAPVWRARQQPGCLVALLCLLPRRR
jgi:hypothetical protein